MKQQRLGMGMTLGMLFSVSYAQQAQSPNIILILADDMGYGDVSGLNAEGKIATPHINSLLNSGVVFTDAHSSSAISTPTRYGLMTGRYCWRTPLKNGVLWDYDAPLIEADRLTIGKMLQQKGYHTACIGKWHLGMDFGTTDGKEPVNKKNNSNLDFSKPIQNGPTTRGFDYFYGVDCPNFPPYCFIENDHTEGIPQQFSAWKGKYLETINGHQLPDWKLENVLPGIEKRAVDYIREKASAENPYFLYFALTSPHAPLRPSAEFQGKSGLNTYADFVVQTDAVVGSIIKAVEESGEADNTIIVFTTDNGTAPVANFKYLQDHGHYPSYIYRGMKSDLFEGGHHVPCVVSWPKRFAHKQTHETICLTDFLATFADLVDYELSDNEAEDSYSMMPLLTGKGKFEREAIVHHSSKGEFAIRKGNWKLLLTSFSGGWSEPKAPVKDGPMYQLYNLKDDPNETKNLFYAYPNRVNDLENTLIRIITHGRSTNGKIQQNQTKGVWKQLKWMKGKENTF